jgi:predicted DNA-binding protein with PD1-like motif
MEAEYRIKRTFLIRLPHGGDLLESINGICLEKRIESGVISVIGAVKSAVVGYYHQEKKEYQAIPLDRPLEIASCTGNISLKNDSTPITHAHIVLSDEAGITAGGHLMSGTAIFAAEAIVTELEGQPLIRQRKDSLTGLPLWFGVKSV